MVYIPRTYVRAAGIQSEISKVAVTKIAHLENDYRRQVHIAKMDMKKSMREIQHNQTIMKRTVRHYTKKLKEYKKAKENKYYDALHVNNSQTARNNDVEIPSTVSSPEFVEDQTDGDVVAATGDGKKDGCDAGDDTNAVTYDVVNHNNDLHTDENDARSNCTAMGEVSLDVDGDGVTTTGVQLNTTSNGHSGGVQVTSMADMNVIQSATGSDSESAGNVSTGNTSEKCDGENDTNLHDEGLTVKSTRKRRSGVVNHINIVKLRYRSNVRALFRAVDVLAKVHGVIVTNINDREIPDPRKLSQERHMSQAARESVKHGTLPSEYLYNMKYGYSMSERKLEEKSPENIAYEETRNLEDENHNRVASLRHSPRISGSKAPGSEVFDSLAKRKISQNSSHDLPVNSKNNAHDSPVNSSQTALSTHSFSLNSKKSVPALPMHSQRLSRSSYHNNDATETPVPELKLPAIKYKTSVGTKHRKGAIIPLPKIYSDRQFERKVSIEETANVQWKTALGKLKLVHFIDTRDL